LLSDVEFPEKRKLSFFEKVPQLPATMKPPKMMKDIYDMRGPELVHNKLQYGQFGIQVSPGAVCRSYRSKSGIAGSLKLYCS
jgi:hypothetical protein